MNGQVFSWGRTPPPLGGVTRSIDAFNRSLADSGVRVHAIDLRKPLTGVPRAILALLSDDRNYSIFHASGPSAALAFSRIASVVGHNRALFLHASEGVPPENLHLAPRLRPGLIRFDRIWVSNQAMLERVHEQTGHPRVEVASPYVPSTSKRPQTVLKRNPRDLLIFASDAKALYNVPLAIAAGDVLHACGFEVSLTVVAYGGNATGNEWPLWERLADTRPWLSLRVGDSRMAEELMERAGVFLRLTSTDGDSLAVREALSMGVRVIASKTAPRPRGVELTDLDPRSVASAVIEGGSPSRGDGLGSPISVAVQEWMSGTEEELK